MDYIVKLPKSDGYDSILVVVCRLTKMAHFIPCTEAMTTEAFARLFVAHVFKLHGFPTDVVTDRGSHFRSAFWKEVQHLCQIEGKLSTSFHPETDGQTERTNQTLEQYLRLYCNYEQNDWAGLLPMAEFACNNAVNASTKASPFFANYGFHPSANFSPPRTAINSEAGHSMVERLKAIHSFLRSEIRYAQDAQAEQANKSRLPATFRVGQKVWLNRKHIDTCRPMRKLDQLRLGPFTITESINNKAFRLDLPASMKIHDVFHPSLLDPHIPSDIPGRVISPPPPVQVDQHEEYEVEAILAKRTHRRKLQYKVRWKGYSPEYDTWEPAGIINKGAPLIVKDFAQHTRDQSCK